MSQANDRQVGGSHYKGRVYQHWDFVTDIELPYLLGCATKYVSRWREKNGVQDLEKAIHYVDKAEEKRLWPSTATRQDVWRESRTVNFAAQHDSREHTIICYIVMGRFTEARELIKELISENGPETPTQGSQG